MLRIRVGKRTACHALRAGRLRSVKKTCVHVVAPDLRIIPLDTYNMFYRDGLEQRVLQPIRKELEAAGMVLLPTQERVARLPVLND